jgi:hypothetical protein
MSIQKVYFCDECGQTRGEGNHWFCVYIGTGSLTLFTWDTGRDGDKVLHVCGEQCLQKQVAKWANK